MIVALRDALNGSVKPVRISETHKATEEAEKQRITSQGGMVMRGRVFGDLSISRAVGDRNYKVPKQEANYVSSDPFITSVTLTHHHLFAIIASDGLWDKLTFEEAVDISHEKLRVCNKIVGSLIYHILEITHIVSYRNWNRKR